MGKKKQQTATATPSGVSRRNFMKGLAGASAAMAGIAAPLEAFAAAQGKADGERAKWIKTVDGYPFKLTEEFKRYNCSHNAFNWIGRHLNTVWNRPASKNFLDLVLSGNAGKGVPVKDVGMARLYAGVASGLWSTCAPFNRTGMGFENVGSQSWTKLTYPPLGPGERKPDITDPNLLTRYTKGVARMVGADQVGIAPFDPNWIYTHSQRNPYQPGDPVLKEIRIDDASIPEETDDALIIPSDAKAVIVLAFGMNRVMVQTSPAYTCDGIVGLGYTRMAIATTGLADFIRTQGYWAIPSNNCTGLSVPMAVQAGLGEVGRHGLLISPELGSGIRLAKVITNMPLNLAKPISFGVESFCESCLKCARECPAKCLTEGSQTTAALNGCNNPGTLKWYNDYQKCLGFWVENGVSCSNCIAVCPFTKGEMWAHGATMWAIDNIPSMNGIWLGLDDGFGYGERRDPSEIWDTVSSYGIDPELFAKIRKAGGR